MIKKKILIIGSNGFLGHNLSLSLNKLGYDLFLLCKKRDKKKISNAKYLYCDLSNKKKLKKILVQDFDFAINVSGNINHNNKKETNKVHYSYIKNVINILNKKKINLFIQIGSSLEYGRSKSPQKEITKCKPISHYGKAKYKTSKFLMSKKFSFNVVILRLYQVYGPFQKSNRLIPYVIKNCLKNKSFNCSDGRQYRDFLYIDDFVNLIIKILKYKKNKTSIYNVGYGYPHQVKNVINRIKLIINKGLPKFGKIEMRQDEIKSLFPNLKKITKKYNWNAKVNLNEGLKKTIAHYINH